MNARQSHRHAIGGFFISCVLPQEGVPAPSLDFLHLPRVEVTFTAGFFLRRKIIALVSEVLQIGFPATIHLRRALTENPYEGENEVEAGAHRTTHPVGAQHRATAHVLSIDQ